MPHIKEWRKLVLINFAGTEYYYLMHKNIKVLAFSLKGQSVLDSRINSDAAGYLPVMYGADIQSWLDNRKIPATREGLDRDFNTISPFSFMVMNLGLSLTDCYWINPVNENYKWEDVNLYNNNFNDTFSLDFQADTFQAAGGDASFTPSASLRGDLKKKWLAGKDGTRFLVKGNSNDNYIQSLSEVLASEIYKRQGFDSYVPYSLVKITSDGREITGCRCPCFTSEFLEFIPAYELVNSHKKPNDINYFVFYKKLLEDNGIFCSNFYDMQIMADFLITNTDRHYNNFGVLRDSGTLELVKPAPVYDSGNSMFYNSSYIPLDKRLLEIEVNSSYNKEVKLLSLVSNRSILDTRLLPPDTEVYKFLAGNGNINCDMAERISQAYRKKIMYFLDFQNGADIWSYKYLKNK